MNNRTRKGFTILEMIVSLAVIAMILAVVLNGLAGTRAKSHDTKRVEDIKQLQNGLQLYYNDNRSYPATLDPDLLVPSYMKAMPKDPTTNQNYLYAVFLINGRCTNYHLGATLEAVPPNTGVLETDFDLSVSPGSTCPTSAPDFDGTDPVYDVSP